MEDMRVFYYRDRTKVLWGKASSSVAKDVLASMQRVVDLTIARLEADFSHADLISSFEIFDVAEWKDRENWGPPSGTLQASGECLARSSG